MKTLQQDELFAVPVPRATASYSPVPHKELVTQIYSTLKSHGLNVTRENYRANSKGTQVVGTFDLQQVGDTDDIGYRLTFRNSYDKSMSVGFFAGAVVKVCSNGLMVPMKGAQVFVRKHTGAVLQEVKQRITSSISSLAPVMQRTLEHSQAMKHITVDTTAAAELCGRLFIEEELINSTQLNIIKREIENPSYSAFTDINLWSFYNHVTHALKESHPTTYVNQHLEFHKFVEAEYNL